MSAIDATRSTMRPLPIGTKARVASHGPSRGSSQGGALRACGQSLRGLVPAGVSDRWFIGSATVETWRGEPRPSIGSACGVRVPRQLASVLSPHARVNDSGLVTPSDEKACQVPVTVPNWACWAVVSAFSNTALIIVNTTAPPVAPLASLKVAASVLVVPGVMPMTVPTSAVVNVACGSLVTLAMIVLYRSVSPLNLSSFPPCPNPPVVMRRDRGRAESHRRPVDLCFCCCHVLWSVVSGT